jgi:hypothetical protein
MTPDGPDSTNAWTGQHRITPDGLDDTNHLELENRCGRESTVGSNPTLSASGTRRAPMAEQDDEDAAGHRAALLTLPPTPAFVR